MNKAVIVGGAALAGIAAMVLFSKEAKAAPKPGPSASPEQAQKCEANKAERKMAQGQINYLDGVIYDLDAARIEAAQNGDDAAYDSLTATQNQAKVSRQNFRNRVKVLDDLIAACP